MGCGGEPTEEGGVGGGAYPADGRHVRFHEKDVRLESLIVRFRKLYVVHGLVQSKLREHRQRPNKVGEVVDVREWVAFQLLQQNAEGVGMLYEQLELGQLGLKTQTLLTKVMGIKLPMLE